MSARSPPGARRRDGAAPTGARDWSQEDIEFLEVLAVHIGIALYQTELFQNEKRLRGEAEEANRQKTSVLSFVSHDLKNPLASIRLGNIALASRIQEAENIGYVIPVEEIELAIHAHPTLSEAIAEAAMDSLGRMIHA